MIHWLFYITGQTVGDGGSERTAKNGNDSLTEFWDRVKKQFAAVGFETYVEIIELERSQATVIVAQKK